MADRTFKIRGIEVEVWKTSFRIEGMSQVWWPTHVSDETIKDFITALYDQIEAKTIKSANRKVAEKVFNLLENDK